MVSIDIESQIMKRPKQFLNLSRNIFVCSQSTHLGITDTGSERDFKSGRYHNKIKENKLEKTSRRTEEQATEEQAIEEQVTYH